ncbi:MAG: hypothetical protein EA001_16440 [Oscillatoriales cyanobacterium]|nr:MAG: hypothetical protein EA001_16440 [Oscillatoriales cyanobacterium]
MQSLRDPAIALARSANQALAAEQWAIAAQGYRSALRLDPTIPGIYINLAAALNGLGNAPAARRACEQAIALDPLQSAGPRNWLRLLDGADRPATIAACHSLLDRYPTCAPLYCLVGQRLHNRDDFPELMDWVRSRPLPETWRTLPPSDRAEIGYWHGLKHYFDRELDRADQWLRQAIADDPDYQPPHIQLSIVLAEQRRLTDALATLDLACDRWPDHGTLRHNRALCLLTLGRWAEGFAENEWQWKSGQMTKKDLPGQEWDGTLIPGRTVLIWADQGFGDSLQWARYLAWVTERCDRVIFMCQKALVSVMQLAPGVAYVTDGAGDTLNFNTHVPLSSLPRLAQTTVDRVPAPIPYLFVPGDRAIAPDHPALTRTSGQRLRVGIVWASGFRAGDRLEEVHRQKSADLTEFAAALNLPQVQLYSLQVDRSEADAARLAELGIIDLAPQIRDFADTAAWLDRLDLLITVDTAICHLAGAMGKPVWTLLYFAADWRWLLDRPDTPWYPTMRLFRQTQAGDWSAPLAQVRSNLIALTRSPQKSR